MSFNSSFGEGNSVYVNFQTGMENMVSQNGEFPSPSTRNLEAI